ncbi:MAG: hypothetical protein M3285_02105 [Actinomycetota bacterium]|nr:hypothetical protein [Actinomycetota bacterium]
MRKAIVVLTILAACGGSGDEGWGADEREEFIAGCESSGNSNETCTCLQEKLEAEYPDAENPDEFDQEKVDEIAKECVG